MALLPEIFYEAEKLREIEATLAQIHQAYSLRWPSNANAALEI